MKINSVSDKILGKVVEDIERRYPLLDGTDNGWPKSLFKSRKDLMNPENNRYPLMREPSLDAYQNISEMELGGLANYTRTVIYHLKKPMR